MLVILLHDIQADCNYHRMHIHIDITRPMVHIVMHLQTYECSCLSKHKWLATRVQIIYRLMQMTGTTDIEEELLGAGGMVPFSIEAKLRKYGANFRQGTSETRPFATRSGSIVTGQNSASTLLTAEGLVEAMSLGVRMTIV